MSYRTLTIDLDELGLNHEIVNYRNDVENLNLGARVGLNFKDNLWRRLKLNAGLGNNIYLADKTKDMIKWGKRAQPIRP